MVTLQYDGTYLTFEDGHRVKVMLHQANDEADTERFLMMDTGDGAPTPTIFLSMTPDEAFKLALALLRDFSLSKFGSG